MQAYVLTLEFCHSALRANSVQILGAHLEAYINTLPAIQTLKACNRYGNSGGITRLPTELVSRIAEHHVQDERTKLEQIWIREHRCAQQWCLPEDHLTTAELAGLESTLRMSHKLRKSIGFDEYCDDDTEDSTIRSYLRIHDDCWLPRHKQLVKSWEERIGASRMSRTSFFEANRELVAVHLGLHIRSDTARAPEALGVYGLWDEEPFRDEYGQQTTTACLALLKEPGKKPVENRLEGNSVHISAQPKTESIQARFDRAMMVLDLEPCVHVANLELRPAGGRKGKQEAAKWPQLTVVLAFER